MVFIAQAAITGVMKVTSSGYTLRPTTAQILIFIMVLPPSALKWKEKDNSKISNWLLVRNYGGEPTRHSCSNTTEILQILILLVFIMKTLISWG